MAATMPSPAPSSPTCVVVHRDRGVAADKRPEQPGSRGKSIAMERELPPRRACSDAGHHRRNSATALGCAPRIKNRVRTADLEQLRFILECFFLSFGPECPQLGRNHPNSDPERYASGRQQQQQPPPQHYRRRSSVDSGSATSSSSCSTIRSSSSSTTTANAGAAEQLPAEYDHDALLREVLRLFEAGLDGNGGPVLLRHQHIAELASLSSVPGGDEEPEPDFAVGPWGITECGICLETAALYRRPCCNFPACTPCLKRYYASRVRQNNIQIECCNVRCHQFVSRDEISARLPADSKEHFHRLLVTANVSTKTCPHCNHVTRRPKPDNQPLKCDACGSFWCYACHAPWHEGLSCRQFRKGDRLLKAWARTTAHGQVNAQRCPKCKIFIQRITGCDHMHCARCKTHFCYRCGDRFRQLKFFGDHYSKLSVFGCKFRYKADKPLQRKVVRGAVFGGKLVAAPIVGVLALCAGVIVVGVGAFAFPLYGGLRLVQRYHSVKKSVNLENDSTPRLVCFSANGNVWNSRRCGT
ncbi:E3 ubiquitin-protein ligase RNF217-like isoform X2 [Dermacentor albipictus]|uniref:E3 ubiquitin-protein ligase RNF217-like isoform X2 n=1 Tax=Dermacentor albipictus TaxID=60249 RepID=UPI0038FC5035